MAIEARPWTHVTGLYPRPESDVLASALTPASARWKSCAVDDRITVGTPAEFDDTTVHRVVMGHKEQAAMEGVTEETVPGAGDTLEKQGLVVRRRHDEDGILVSNGLSENGLDPVNGVLVALNRQQRENRDLLHPADQLALDRALRRPVHIQHKNGLLEGGE